ncbi:MAG: hypothetical protein HYU75_12655, partial [Betaproteobacteria bacterium]|nr:hypothetical protein [Betaproteobacteria bacterium]
AVLLAVWLLVPRAPFAGLGSYLPFHMFAETLSIIVSMMIFGVMWNAYSAERSGGLLMLSCAMLAAGLLDFGHMLSVSRMPDFVTPSSPDKGIAFWLSARTIATAGLLAAALRLESSPGSRRFRYWLLGTSLGVTALVYWLVLFHPDVLPRFFVEGKGLTPIKIGTEISLTAVLALPAILFYRRARRTRSAMPIGLYAAASISLLSEFYFAIYGSRHDLFQVLGHIYKVVAYLFIYRAVFLQGIREPFDNLHRQMAERKQAEEEVRRLNQELEERVAARTAQLEAANKELDAFAYSVSHDLRAPLRGMDQFSRILLGKDECKKMEQDSLHCLQMIRDNARQMGRLIDDLLAFSRLSQQALAKEPVDQDALVHAALRDLETQSKGKPIDLSVGRLGTAEADPKLLKQVWINLIDNALKYTGGRDKAVIRIGAETKNGVPEYFVADNGVGFDMRYADKLFGVFQRLHRAEDYEGTGVGLAIVQRIVGRHGGRVWAKAAKDQGATFYFTLQGTSDHA